MAIWSKGDLAGDMFDASIHTVLQAVLVSPHFLYRYERMRVRRSFRHPNAR